MKLKNYLIAFAVSSTVACGDSASNPSDGGVVNGETGRLVGMTQAHNEVRRGVNIPDLVWSNQIAAFAQQWADEMASNGCGPSSLQHRPSSGPFAQKYGENIAWNSGSMATAQEVVGRWASEVQFYDYASNTCQTGEVCGHYTQIVWAQSTKLGCGFAACGNSEFWVCNFDPPGNFIGQKPY